MRLASIALLATLLAPAAHAAGRVEEVSFPTRFDGRTRRIWVRTPAVRADSANLLVAFDGLQWFDEIPLDPMLDSLERAGRSLHHRRHDRRQHGVRPHCRPGNRAAFADWVADGLVP